MTEKSTRQLIIDAARSQFMSRGFTGTTIREIAAAAGVSPALVIKLTGSKAQLFRLATPDIAIEDAPREDELPGYRLVRAIVDRRNAMDFEYWVAAPAAVLESPDRDAARDEMRDLVLREISAAIGDKTTEKLRTRLVITMLMGLAASLRTLQLIPDAVLASEDLTARYGAMVQAVIDDAEI